MLAQTVMVGVFLFVGVVSLQSLHIRLTLSETAFADSSEGPPSSTATSTATSQGTRGNGAASGNETTRIKMVAKYYLVSIFGVNPATIAEHGPSEKLSAWEAKFLCGMKKIRVRGNEKTMSWLPDYLATLLHRPLAQILEGLRDPACTLAPGTQSWVN